MAKEDFKEVQKAIEEILQESDLLEHKDLKTKKRDDLKQEWFYFARSYLEAAETLIDTSIKDKTISGRMHNLPAIYNFRHAIELSLKFLYRFTNKDFNKSHDITELYSAVIENIKKHTGFKIKEFIKNGNTKLTEEKVIKTINENIEILDAIINKYYFHTPLTKLLKNEHFFIEDQGNELFKYPEAKNVTFYFKSIGIVNLPDEELRLIKSDIEKMSFINNFFYALFNSQISKSKK